MNCYNIDCDFFGDEHSGNCRILFPKRFFICRYYEGNANFLTKARILKKKYEDGQLTIKEGDDLIKYYELAIKELEDK